LGWLFKSKTGQKQKTNLLVFITPKIIRNSQDNSDLLDSKLNERIDFIQQNMKGRDPYGYEVDRLPRRALVEESNEAFLDPATQESNAAPADQGDNGASVEEALPGDYEEGE
jgi:general secretion pathway protein D